MLAGVLEPLRRQVYDTLRRSILEFRIKPGERLPEREIAERTGAPPATVREVLRELAEDGIVETTPDNGAVVTVPSPREAIELDETRNAIESLAVRRFVQNASDSQIDALRRALREFQRAVVDRASPAELLKARDRFYIVLLRAAGQITALSLLAGLYGKVILVMSRSLSEPGRAGDTAREFQRIFDALAARDAEAAVRACSHHLEQTTTAGLRGLAASGVTAP
ncbi:MAG: FCD domain-containing protein [Pseudonocardiaceae bacterium]|nr:FCD domain-containing protein [Pseudonocardiaceae bacterium]